MEGNPVTPPPLRADILPPGTPDFLTVQAKHGRFYLNRHDVHVGYSLVFYGEYCELEWAFFKRFIKPGDTVIDAGANIGALAVPMAQAVGPSGRVLAFEPQPVIFQCLKQNALQNDLPQLLPLPFGLGAEERVIETAPPDYAQQGTFSGFSLLQDGRGLKAKIVKLDDIFTAPSLAFMKMDIEGMEFSALQGSGQTLARLRPVLYVENDKREKSAALIGWLLQQNYRLWWHTSPMFNPQNGRQETTNLYGQIHNINMICLPVERVDLLPLIPETLVPITHADDTLHTPMGVRLSLAEGGSV